MNAEERRLKESQERSGYWRRWGPYLSERQWGTVREDYCPDGDGLGVLPPRPRPLARLPLGRGRPGRHLRRPRSGSASRWPSGTSSDPILKERLFGLTGPEGNHGEDVKEYYFYLDATPDALVHEVRSTSTRRRRFPTPSSSRRTAGAAGDEPEYELLDTGVFADDRYFDVVVEYAKAAPDDILIRITVDQPRPRGGAAAPAADALVPQHLVLGTPATPRPTHARQSVSRRAGA